VVDPADMQTQAFVCHGAGYIGRLVQHPPRHARKMSWLDASFGDDACYAWHNGEVWGWRIRNGPSVGFRSVIIAQRIGRVGGLLLEVG
jgi:hypothetical protein